ncbi:hypothetical protein CFOL_v3_22014 [Cephalotus follicularis]|uniref:Uncharacterized protein n=1 Tax=Cephalotus follicularis TaxID=3775 RepID=A0A1Q3CEK4_CEPFO|nr:hypothetical protein CFOL_v3_22014 [Cephalotus follicularis]
MGLIIVALAKLTLLSSSHTISPLLSGFLWPFALKLSFSLRIVRRAFWDVIHSSRLFFFQLGQIASDTHEPALGSNTRWERALRLVSQRLRQARRQQAIDQSVEDSLHRFTVLSL